VLRAAGQDVKIADVMKAMPDGMTIKLGQCLVAPGIGQTTSDDLRLDGGRVAEQGTHDELLVRRGIYWYLYNSYGRV